MVSKKVGSAGRFGARYGNTLRRKVSLVEQSSRAKHKCNFCGKVSVKREVYGIWKCKSCLKTFVGDAYRPY